MEHSHDETLFSEIEKSSLVVAFFPDRKKTACRYYMIDEVREVLKRVINDNTDISGFSAPPACSYRHRGITDARFYKLRLFPIADRRHPQGPLQEAGRTLPLFLQTHQEARQELAKRHVHQAIHGNQQKHRPTQYDDTIEWVSYAINDMDNAISNIDRNDPMTFFDLALSLEKTLKGK